MKKELYYDILLPNKEMINLADEKLNQSSSFKITISKKHNIWLADKVFPFVVNFEEEDSVWYTLLGALWFMDIHEIFGAIREYNESNKYSRYKIVYRRGGTIYFTHSTMS